MYGPFGADAEDENTPLQGNPTGESSYQADSSVGFDVPDANEPVETEEPEPQPQPAVATAPEPEIIAAEPEPEQEPEPESAIVPEPVTVARETIMPEIAPEPVPGATVEPNPEADTLIARAAALIGEGTESYVEAREKLNQALRMPMSPKQREYVKTQLSELSKKWLFSRAVLPNDPLCEYYRVRPGDIFEIIGRENKVPYEILQEINNISNPRSLQAGQSIKVVKGPFHAKVYRSTFTMDVYLQNTYVRSFIVGLGKPGTETPTGLWRLRPGGKAHATSWRDPDTGKLYQPEDPDYPLGSRWMALDGLSGEAKGREGFGIHGTKEPEQIGTAGSRGCIRMYNGEAILVYKMLVDGLSQVEVTD
jgi:LysM repeat protein